MKEKIKLNGFYNYTVVLTYLGMICGFMGITSILDHEYRSALIYLMAAGIFDMFDGTIAATRIRTESEKRFGIEIDSLSDLICFGVLPALFLYQTGTTSGLTVFASILYLLCALIRLAYFNVCEIERQQQEEKRRTWYTGLPVTTIALILPILYIMINYFQLPVTQICSIIMSGVAIAFVLPFRLKKPEVPGKIGMLLTGMMELMILISGVGLGI